MNLGRNGKLRRGLRRVVKRFASKGLILMYHRVAEVDIDPWSLCVTPRHFAEHLEVLRKYCHPMTLKQLAQAQQDGNIPHRAVAVTFDDGYVDNLHHAKPLLERYNIPATVFVTTGHLGQEREFWWDELERVLLQPGRLPETLSLAINGSTQQWELGEAIDYSQEDYRCDRDRKPWDGKPGSRLSFYYSIWKLLKPLPEAEQLKVLDDILTWAEVKPVVRSTYRSVLPEEVPVLGQGELVEVGAHTVTHPFLSAHSADFQRDEIQRSKAYLEELLEQSVTSFAYPYGDYTPQTVRLIQDAGFNCACSTVADTVWRYSDRFQLPRFAVHNWNGEEFTKQLLRWFHE